MRLARLVTLSLGVACAAAVAACGSNGVEQFPDHGGGGGPASAVPTKVGPDAGGSTSSSSGSGGGSSSGGSSGSGSGSSSGGDAAVGSFGTTTVAAFTLINAQITDDPVGSPISGFDPITYGSTIDLGTVGLYLSMRADPPPIGTVGSIAFALDATYTHTSNAMPYSLCGDDGKGNFTPCVLPVGPHTLTATMYPLPDLGGAPYQPPTVFQFTVIDSALDGGTEAGP
ncbi:MAG TPA: hypothetical protein VGL81_28500 [Polyangiaceae bacterium]|jgi:hypothetical protein